MAIPDLDFDQIKFTGDIPAELDPAPKPSKKKDDKKRPVGRPTTQSKLQEVENEFGNILKLLLLPVLLRDQHLIYDEQGNWTGETVSCANVYCTFDMKLGKPTLTKEGEQLTEAAAAIIFESPFLMKVLASGDDMGKWLKLAMALQPGVLTVFHNHVRMRNTNGGQDSVE